MVGVGGAVGVPSVLAVRVRPVAGGRVGVGRVDAGEVGSPDEPAVVGEREEALAEARAGVEVPADDVGGEEDEEA